MGIGLRGSLRGVLRAESVWEERTMRLLVAAEASESERLRVPIRALFEADDEPD
jgi:hypothetical protein